MPIVTISYGGSDLRDNIANEIARELGYECHGREVISNASKEYGIPQSKLSKVVHYGPSFFGMSVAAIQRYVACILAAAAEFLLRDDIVYHGPAAHVIGSGIAHVLKVRVIPNKEARIAYEMEKNRLPREKAIEHIERDEEERRKSVQNAYGVEDTLRELYEIIVDLNEVSMDEGVQRVVEAATSEKYQVTPHSRKSAENAELSHRIRASIVDINPNVDVWCDSGRVSLRLAASTRGEESQIAAIRERVEVVNGVSRVDIEFIDHPFDKTDGTAR